METFLGFVSKFSILFALAAAIIAGILANIVASLLEKVAGEHPHIKILGPKKQLCLVSTLFVVFSLPAIYQQFILNSADKVPPTLNTTNEKNTNQVFRVQENDTITLFNNDLSITLAKYYCFASVEREIVVGSPGLKNLIVDTFEVGDSFVYTGHKAYEIRVVKLDTYCSWIEIQAFELSVMPEIPKYTLKELKTENITVNLYKTGFSSDNKLSISVAFSSPATGASAVLGSSGFPNKSFSSKDIGYATEYETDNNVYNIRILEISNEAVKFQIVNFLVT